MRSGRSRCGARGCPTARLAPPRPAQPGASRRRLQEIETELDLEFLRRMFDRIHWGALVQGARDLGYAELPEQATAAMLDDADFAK